MARVPNELWVSVFEGLDSPKDLANVVLICKRFKTLGTGVLYRHIIWTDPLKFVRNHPFLQRNTHLRHVTRTLMLGISTATSDLDSVGQLSRARAIVHLSGSTTLIHRPNRGYEARDVEKFGNDLLASEHVSNTIYNHVSAFTNLRDLMFNSMVLPDIFYDFVHNFPALDRLVIENCTPPLHPHPTNRHPCDLPITELTIVGLRGWCDELHAFAEGQQLRVLRFDWTYPIDDYFSEGFAAALAELNLPEVPQPLPAIPFHQHPVLSPHIHTIDVKFPARKSWQSSEPDDDDIGTHPFARFLVKCPGVINLHIRNYLPWLGLPDYALPNLAYYQGPVTTIKSVVSGPRRIKHLAIGDLTGGLVAIENAFEDIKARGAGADLETLSLFVSRWDDEILYAILHHFNGLKQLEIKYREGNPTEKMVMIMGPHFFGLMPNLWSVRVFKVPPPDNPRGMAVNVGAHGRPASGGLPDADNLERPEIDDDDDDFEEGKVGPGSSSPLAEDLNWEVLKEVIQVWNRYCPVLREVQLTAGYVWRRADPDDVWAQRTV